MGMADDSARSILFVCTGNIFRSLVAEYALKRYLGPQGLYCVGSARIEAKLHRSIPSCVLGSWSRVLIRPGMYNAS